MVDKKANDWEYVSETVIFVGYMPRTTPFGVYNFFVSIIGEKALGGFSAVSGSQIKVAPAGVFPKDFHQGRKRRILVEGKLLHIYEHFFSVFSLFL
jgi:hypothetical protein